MDNKTKEEIKYYLFKDPTSNEANNFIKLIEEKIKDLSIEDTSAEELFHKIPEELKTDKQNQKKGIELLNTNIEKILFSRYIQKNVQKNLNRKKEKHNSTSTPKEEVEDIKFIEKVVNEIIQDKRINGIQKTEEIFDLLTNEINHNSNLTIEQINNLKEIKNECAIIKKNYNFLKNTSINCLQKEINLKKLSKDESYQKIQTSLEKLLTEEKEFQTIEKLWPSDYGNLLQELQEDILSHLHFYQAKKTPKSTTEKKKEEKIWLKALAGSTGFIAGIGINIAIGTVPILGTGIAIYSGARTLYNTGKLICNISTKINQNTEPKIITKIKKKIPAKVIKTSKIIFEKPNNPYLKWFVNGMTLGYTLDKLLNLHEKLIISNQNKRPIENTNLNQTKSEPLKSEIHKEQSITPTPTKAPSSIPKQETPVMSNVTASNPIKKEAINTTTVQETINNLKTGTTINISELEYGYAGPGQKAVHLLNERGINATFDKTNTINGEVWIHFKQENGAGYAWFPKEQVEKILQKTLQKR